MRRMTSAAVTLISTLFVVACQSTGAAATAVVATDSPGPVAMASPAGSVEAAFVCEEETSGCAGPLQPGEHTTARFDHPFTFTVPEGWTNVIDRGRAYALRLTAAPESEFIVWSQAAIEEQTADCSPSRKPGFGTTVADWLEFLTTHPGLETSEPVTIDLGGHQATRVGITVKDTWDQHCEGNSDPVVLLVTDTGQPPTRSHLVGFGGRAAMTLIDFGEDTLIVWNDGSQTMIDEALPVIESMRFSEE